MEQVVLVDESGEVCQSGGEIQTLERKTAHRQGILHLAVSAFIFNTPGDLLLQRRSYRKDHSACLWANTCCTHPRKGEDPLAAAKRRLREEMGLSCEIREVCSLSYRCDVGSGLIEHEYDHLFVGLSESDPSPDPEEVVEWRWMSSDDVVRDLKERHEIYAPWFGLLYPEVLKRRYLS